MVVIRATVNRGTGFTPNRMMLGREVMIPLHLMLGSDVEEVGRGSDVEEVGRGSTFEA